MGEMTILDYSRVVWRARVWILCLVVGAALVALVAGRFQPKVYRVRATVLTPKESGIPATAMSLGALIGGLGGQGAGGSGGGFSLLPGLASSVSGLATNEDMFLALLRSRTLQEEVLGEFSKTWGSSVGSLLVSVEPSTKEKGVIAVVVEAKDPKLAADLANAYFERLEVRIERNAARSRKREEGFYASQLEQSAKEVAAAEEALLKFQAANRLLINLDPTTKANVETGASLRGTIMALEMQREVMRMRVTEQHPQMRELQKQIAELKRQYSQNLFGAAMDLPPESPSAKGPRQEFFVAAARMTPVQFAFLRLFRNLKIQEAFYVAAFQGLEQLKYQQGVLPMSVEVVDPARPPSAPVRPNVPLIVVVAAASALVVGFLLAFVLAYLARLRSEERGRRESLSAARQKRAEDGQGAPGEPGRVPAAARAFAVHPSGPAAPRPGTVPGTKR